jgi:hypothetical protein
VKIYSCQFAPVAANWRDVIRVAQLVRAQGVSAYEAFAPDAFRGWGAAEIPVLIDHDEDRRGGSVTVVTGWKDWMLADFILDGPYAERAAELIERSGKVSPGFTWHERDPVLEKPHSPDHHPTHWITRARLDEISLLAPGSIGWYAGARVTRVSEMKEPTVTRTASNHSDAGEIIHGGELIVRHGIGQVLRVR